MRALPCAGSLRKNVIPHEYRKHFPTEMKDHNSHDVLAALHLLPRHLQLLRQPPEAAAGQGVPGPHWPGGGLAPSWEDPERRQVRLGPGPCSTPRACLRTGRRSCCRRCESFIAQTRSRRRCFRRQPAWRPGRDLRSCSEGSEDWASVFTPTARFECL